MEVAPGPGAPPTHFALRLTAGATVTLADAGQRVRLAPGERFFLDLGDGYAWSVAVGDEAVVHRVAGAPAPGADQPGQGVFEARGPGRTILTAAGDPACAAAVPACLLPSLFLEVEVVVG